MDSDAGVHLLVLGPVRLRVGGREFAPRPLQGDVLSALLLHRGGPVSAPYLSTMVWGDYRRTALHPAVSRLRGWLREVAGNQVAVDYVDNAYQVATSGEIDTCLFDELVVQAGAGEDSQRLATWIRALTLYRAAPADGTRREIREHSVARDWALRRATAIAEATGLALRLDQAQRLRDPVAKASAEHPDNEYIQASWALLLAATGQRPEALVHMERYRARLSERFGTDPVSDYFHRAQRRILRHQQAPAAAAVSPVRHQWRGARPVTVDIVGRARELRDLDAMLESRRVLTIVGTGGIGKSSLAFRLAEGCNSRRSVVAVALQSAETFDEVLAALAAACGGADDTLPLLNQVKRGLAAGPWLVLVDNCDRIGAPVAALVEHLLAANPELTVLATSRTPLGIGGEQVWRLDPLTPPAEAALDEVGGPAVSLFYQVARRFDPQYRPDRAERRAVGRICRLVDGMPLAIEILASRIPAFTAVELVDNLSVSGSALDIPHRSVDPRHHSMSATLDWTFDRVPSRARELLAAVSILSAPFAAELAAQLAGTSAHSVAVPLAELVDHSLLRPIRHDGRTRFLALEPVRQHAGRRLDSETAAQVADRLIAYWLRFAREVDAKPRYRDRLAFMSNHHRDAPHLVLAISLAHGRGEDDRAAEILARAYEFWMCGYDLPGRGNALLTRYNEIDVDDRELNCLLRYWSGLQASLSFDYRTAQRVLAGAREDLASHRPRELRQALLLQSTATNARLDESAVDQVTQAIALLGEDTEDGMPFVGFSCGMATALTWGRYDMAHRLVDRHDRLAAEAGHQPSNAHLGLRVELAVAVGDQDAAHRFSHLLLRRLCLPGSVGDAEPIYCAVARTHLAAHRPAAAARTAHRGIRELERRWSAAASRTLALRILFGEALRRLDLTDAALEQFRHVLDHARQFRRVEFAAIAGIAAATGDRELAGAWERWRRSRDLPIPPMFASVLTRLREPLPGDANPAETARMDDLIDAARRRVR